MCCLVRHRQDVREDVRDILNVGLRADLRSNLDLSAADTHPPQTAVALPDLAVPIQQPPLHPPASPKMAPVTPALALPLPDPMMNLIKMSLNSSNLSILLSNVF